MHNNILLILYAFFIFHVYRSLGAHNDLIAPKCVAKSVIQEEQTYDVSVVVHEDVNEFSSREDQEEGYDESVIRIDDLTPDLVRFSLPLPISNPGIGVDWTHTDTQIPPVKIIKEEAGLANTIRQATENGYSEAVIKLNSGSRTTSADVVTLELTPNLQTGSVVQDSLEQDNSIVIYLSFSIIGFSVNYPFACLIRNGFFDFVLRNSEHVSQY